MTAMRILVVNTGSSSLKLQVLGGGGAGPSRQVADWDGEDLGPLSELVKEAGDVDAVGHRVVHGGLELRDPVLVDDEVVDRLRALTPLAPLHQERALAGIAAARRVLPDVPQVACFDTAHHATLPPAAATYALPAAWRERWPLRRFGFHGLSHAYAARRAAELVGWSRSPAPAETGPADSHLASGLSADDPAPGRAGSGSLPRPSRGAGAGSGDTAPLGGGAPAAGRPVRPGAQEPGGGPRPPGDGPADPPDRLGGGGGPTGLRVVTCHLGSGASLCASQDGRSVDTTMGFTPLEGLVMGTRAGSVDPGLVLWLITEAGLPAAEVQDKLEHASGLAGLAGTNDMAEVVDRRRAGDEAARLAFDVYVHVLAREIAAMTASLGGLDALVFTGGVGEHAPEVRAAAAARLRHLGVAVDPTRNAAAQGGDDTDITGAGAMARTLVVTAREDLEIARLTRALLTDHP